MSANSHVGVICGGTSAVQQSVGPANRTYQFERLNPTLVMYVTWLSVCCSMCATHTNPNLTARFLPVGTSPIGGKSIFDEMSKALVLVANRPRWVDDCSPSLINTPAAPHNAKGAR